MSETGHYQGPIWRKGKQVLLCPHQREDIPRYQHWINDPENNQYLLVNWPMHEAGQNEWFERVSKSDPDHIGVAIRTLDGTLIGNMSMTIYLRKQCASTATLIGSKEHQGQGYGTDAKMLMLDYAFNWRGLRKVTSPIIAFNGRSQSYAKRCGYRHMATIEAEHFRNGVWHNEEHYVVFRNEWLPLWEQYQKELKEVSTTALER